MREILRKGTTGWVALAAGVVAWDLTSDETLTHAFRRAREHPVSFAALIAGWTILTAHLFGVLPARVDPFIVTFHAAKKVTVHDPAKIPAC